MLRFLALLAMFSGSAAYASPQIPDSKSVTQISEAAKLCELTEVGIDWNAKSEKTIAISLGSAADLSPESSKMARLKECFFTWAYDREVAVEFSMKESTAM
jgi:hypothetical protein